MRRPPIGASGGKDEPIAQVLATARALSGALGDAPAAPPLPGHPLRLRPEDDAPPLRGAR